jgi:nucleoside-diphosphate-sugar epimerase
VSASEPLVAVTGASGFIGRAFCARASRTGRGIRRLVRVPDGDGIAVDLAGEGDDEIVRALEGVATVVHLAGRAHVAGETGARVDAVYRDANAAATQRLAACAVAAGVRRFVFASTVKVNGEATPPGQPFRPGDAPAPQDAYARSKLAAETALFDAARGSPMAVVVLRLPLVYGAGVKGNLRTLIEAVRARRWLPVGAIDNRRSLLGVDNLLDALDAVVDAPAAPHGVHFVADAASVSTPDLVRAIARALGVAPRIAIVPVPLLRIAGTVTGRRAAIDRLAGSLEVDASSLAAMTGWTPRGFAIDAATVTR